MTDVILEEESLRDGLQGESRIFTGEEKFRLFNLLAAAGLTRIQAGSFVNPRLVPQMADIDAFVGALTGRPGVLITALVLNDKGLERALACGLGHVSLSASLSDAHSRKNVGRSADEALRHTARTIVRARAAGLTVRGGLQCAFGCAYEGPMAEERVLAAAETLVRAGASEINLADTAGMGNPAQVGRLAGRVKELLPGVALSLHLHDTAGLGLANMTAGFEAGVRIFDTAVGGLGGCPFVRGAAGNVPTEDAVHLFETLGASTGVDLVRLCRAVDFLEQTLGRSLPGRACRVPGSPGECGSDRPAQVGPSNGGGA